MFLVSHAGFGGCLEREALESPRKALLARQCDGEAAAPWEEGGEWVLVLSGAVLALVGWWLWLWGLAPWGGGVQSVGR